MRDFEKSYGLMSSRRILEAHHDYDFFGIIPYGPLRAGKSSYTIQILAEIFGEWRDDSESPSGRIVRPRWDAWEKWLFFHPRDVLEKWKHVQAQGKQFPVFAWDDAGLWANSQRWQDELQKAITGYGNVVASNFAGLILTTPNPALLLKIFRTIPGFHTARISKVSGAPGDRNIREATVYEGWVMPDLKPGHPKSIYKDAFNIRLPDEVFQKYDKVRRSYVDIALRQLEEVVEKMIRKGEIESARRMEAEIALRRKELPTNA